MTLPSSDRSGTTALTHIATPRVPQWNTCGLEDTPAGTTDRDALLAHLGRETLHASKNRDFSSAYFLDSEGKRQPRLYRVDSTALTKCQYVTLTNKQYAAVLVIDIDQPGEHGGYPANLAASVREKFAQLITHNIGPAWVGINPLSGKAQALWLIDPVYANTTGKSAPMGLLAVASRTLGEFLDHDPHFAHSFSRSPFYQGDDPTAYRWYCQHKRVYRLADLLQEVRTMIGHTTGDTTTRKTFTSGTELITAVKERREEAQAFKALASDVESELGSKLDQYDPELINGVRVLWIHQGRAARDETAFRHALKTAHRLRAAGQRMTDAAIIDAYEHAYGVAQQHGGDGRDSQMPPMRDRQTMARRVRGYVMGSKTGSIGSSYNSHRATTAERKALATMGRKGGKKSAERWKNDPDGEYAKTERKKLAEANKRRKASGTDTRGQILMMVSRVYTQTGETPSWREIVEEIGVSRRTVAYHVAALKKVGLYPTK